MSHTRWEYVTVTLVASYGLQYRLNGEKQAQWKDKEIFVVLNDLGRAGFEYVSFDGTQYIFKRPAPVRKTGALE